MPVQVIGAGLPRTGTASLRDALEQLGFKRCYHMFACLGNKDFEHWVACENALSGSQPFDFEEVFSKPGREPYQAAVDFPASLYYKEILKQYPDAKVVLGVRDSAEKWVDSYLDTVGSKSMRQALNWWPIFRPAMRKAARMLSMVQFDNPRFQNKHYDKEYMIDVYNQWIEDVKATVPSKQLLIFNAKQGWDPLCKFLGVPVPKEPFPNVNDREEIKKILKKSSRTALVRAGTVAGVVVAVGFFISKALRMRG